MGLTFRRRKKTRGKSLDSEQTFGVLLLKKYTERENHQGRGFGNRSRRPKAKKKTGTRPYRGHEWISEKILKKETTQVQTVSEVSGEVGKQWGRNLKKSPPTGKQTPPRLGYN